MATKPELTEVNFWQPSAGPRPVALEQGQLFLFKLHELGPHRLENGAAAAVASAVA